MQVSVETLNGLERKLTVVIPAKEVNEQVSSRLNKVAKTAKIDGFRPGKAPLSVVKQKHLGSIYGEVANELIRSTIYDAMQAEKVQAAGFPEIDPQLIEADKDFTYHAVVEVYPEISIVELDKDKVEIVKSEVKDKDMDLMIEKLLEQHKEWTPVERAVADGDQIIFDFEGFVDGAAFDGGKAENHELVIGEGKMIPGFETGIIGAVIGKEIEIKVTFPKDYGSEELSGKDAIFKINVKEIKEGKKPELSDAFVEEKFNVKEGGVKAFKEDIKANMVRQLEREVSSKNRGSVFDKLAEKNAFDLPKTLVDKEIERMAHELYHRVFGKEHRENEKMPELPREMFEAEAKKRVHLGLLFSEYVEKHKIKVDAQRIDALVDKLAGAYEEPEKLRESYRGNKERMAEIESMVLEEMVAEKLLETAKIIEKTMNYDEVVNPSQETEN